MSDSTLFDQAVASLRRLSDEMRSAGDSASVGPTRAVQRWTATIETAVADLLEVQRRHRYDEMLAVGAALVDTIVEASPVAAAPASEAPAPEPCLAGTVQP